MPHSIEFKATCRALTQEEYEEKMRAIEEGNRLDAEKAESEGSDNEELKNAGKDGFAETDIQDHDQEDSGDESCHCDSSEVSDE